MIRYATPLKAVCRSILVDDTTYFTHLLTHSLNLSIAILESLDDTSKRSTFLESDYWILKSMPKLLLQMQ